MFTIVLRKGYGLGAQAMAGGSFAAPFFAVAWPSGEFGAMGLEGAVGWAIERNSRPSADEASARRCTNDMVDASYERGKALSMASILEIDAVIDPTDSRLWISAGLRPRCRRCRAAAEAALRRYLVTGPGTRMRWSRTPREVAAMTEHTSRTIEITGSSQDSFEDAVTNAVTRTGETVATCAGSRYADVRGHLINGRIVAGDVAEDRLRTRSGFTTTQQPPLSFGHGVHSGGDEVRGWATAHG